MWPAVRKSTACAPRQFATACAATDAPGALGRRLTRVHWSVFEHHVVCSHKRLFRKGGRQSSHEAPGMDREVGRAQRQGRPVPRPTHMRSCLKMKTVRKCTRHSQMCSALRFVLQHTAPIQCQVCLACLLHRAFQPSPVLKAGPCVSSGAHRVSYGCKTRWCLEAATVEQLGGQAAAACVCRCGICYRRHWCSMAAAERKLRDTSVHAGCPQSERS